MKSFVPVHSISLEDFQNQISDWMWGTDENNVLIYSNDRLDDFFLSLTQNFLGLEFIELARNLDQVRSPSSQIPLQQLARKFENKQKFHNIPIQCVSKNGQNIKLFLKGRPCFDDNQRFLGYRGVGRIEADHDQQDDAGPSFETLMIAAENSPNGVVITDEKGVIRYANQGSCDMTGYCREECYGETPRLFRSGHTSLSVYSNFWTTLLQGKTWRGTVYNQHKNGEYFWCREVVTPVLQSDGTISNFVAVQEDVTFRLIAEEELKQSEERFKDFAKVASDYYWETDADLKISSISDITRDFSIDILDELFSHAKKEKTVGEVSPALWSGLLDHLVAKRSFKNYIHLVEQKKDRKSRWQISGEPFYLADGEFGGYRGVVTDITSTAELEEKLDQSKKMEQVGQRAGGIAHDFNNLLGIIMGNAELLKEKYDIAGMEVDTNLENILYATKRGINISNQLLVFSRKQSLNPEPVDLDQQIHQMMQVLKSSIGDDIRIDLDIATDLWSCYVDADHFLNAILNLSINSRDAMHNAGVIEISMENQTIEQDMSAKDISQGDYVVVTISDQGDGISEENLRKVYEPFYSSKEQGKGTGLGLSMVYGFAKKSGGAIWIESTVGIGTKVHLFLPKYRGRVAPVGKSKISTSL